MSPDWAAKAEPIPYAKMGYPQTLNLYAYVENNPLTRGDADGHQSIGDCAAGADACQKTSKARAKSDRILKIMADVRAALKTMSVTIEVGVGVKAEDKQATGSAHIGASIHGELKVSKNGDEATLKAEADLGIKSKVMTAGGEAGFKTESDKNGMVNGVKGYAESERGLAAKEHEGTSNGEEYSFGASAYTPDGGGGLHLNISKEAVDKVIEGIGEAISSAREPKEPKKN